MKKDNIDFKYLFVIKQDMNVRCTKINVISCKETDHGCENHSYLRHKKIN